MALPPMEHPIRPDDNTGNSPELAPIRVAMTDAVLDAVAIVPGANFKKLFKRDFHLMERPLLVLIPLVGEAVAIVPNLELASFAEINFQGLVFDWRDEDGYRRAFADAASAMPQLASARFGIEAQRMRVFEYMALQASFANAKFVDAHADISTIRLHKTIDEVELLRRAIAISERALAATLDEVAIGQSEKQIEGMLVKQLFAHGAQGLSFQPIVAAGDNSAQPHASARADYFIKRGDALLFDFGANWEGYNADITRTFFVGEASDYDREFYQTVLAANQRGRQVCRCETSAGDGDDAVQQVLETSRFAEFVRHKTGHGLGLEVHEAPQIMRGNSQRLASGMVFTIEPGLYREGECGVRIEDVVLATDEGNECLTTFPRDLRVVGG